MKREKASNPKGGFHRFISRMRAGIVSIDALTCQILDGNPAMLKMFGYSKPDLLRLRLTDLHPAETLNQIEKALKEQVPFLSEIPCRKADGTILFADLQLIRSKPEGKGFTAEDAPPKNLGGASGAVRSLSGNVLARSARAGGRAKRGSLIEAVFTDVTERKLSLDRIRKALQEKEQLAEAQSELVITLNPQGEVLSANRSVFEALGYGKASLIGRELVRFLPPAKGKEMLEVLTRASLGETVRGFGTELVKKNRQTMSVSFDLIPIRQEELHKIDVIVLVSRDTTEQGKLIRELMAAKKEVEELYAELRDTYQELKETQDELVRQGKLAATGELAAAVAHEIRNPLSIINMSVQYIHGKLGPEDALREFTEAIIEKVTRVDRITKELIDYGRPRELALRPVDIQRVIDSVLRLAAARARPQRVEIHRKFSCHLPLVRIDVERMDEVFSNLITNALDAMPGGGHLTVTLREDPDGNRVLVEVANTGKGISPRKRAQLFTPFFTTKPDGTGLGLAICQRIVDEHHGSISAASKISGPNKGVRFTVSLPVASPEQESAPVKGAGESMLTQKAI